MSNNIFRDYLFLCLFFRSFFFRLCVAIFCRFRFFPQGTWTHSFL